MSLAFDFSEAASGPEAISPLREMGAYEALWNEDGATFKTISDRLRKRANAVPSDLVEPSSASRYSAQVVEILHKAKVKNYGVRVLGAGEYPARLKDADYPVAVLYYQGWWDLVNSRSVAVVGTRDPSKEALARTRNLVRALVGDGFTIVSGLAQGIDTAAHETAIAVGGRTIAVLGTPLGYAYPAANRELQERIASEFLIISQVPFTRWSGQGPKQNRVFFPERNITMAALTEATIIVEAGETSGTLVQARHALKQKRKLFILDSCFANPKITWPFRFEEKGAIRVRNYDDIAKRLPPTTNGN